jgi:hypothetical protein
MAGTSPVRFFDRVWFKEEIGVVSVAMALEG